MNVRAIIAEALGTFVLVGLGSLSIVALAAYGTFPPILTVPFGFGLALMTGIAMFGHVSGGHFNPAVTLAAWIDRRLDWMSAVGYVVAQFVGAILASMMVLLLFSKEAVTATLNVPAAGAVPDTNAFVIETILTTVFVAVILTITNRAPSLAVLVIPLTLVMIHFVGIPLTGASVNPARSLGPAIIAGNYEHIWVYLTAPFAGSVLGWLIYRFVSMPEDEDVGEVEVDDEDDDLLDDEDELAAG